MELERDIETTLVAKACDEIRRLETLQRQLRLLRSINCLCGLGCSVWLLCQVACRCGLREACLVVIVLLLLARRALTLVFVLPATLLYFIFDAAPIVLPVAALSTWILAACLETRYRAERRNVDLYYDR